MKNTICGADCAECDLASSCKGCIATGGKPFGAPCPLAVCCQSKEQTYCGQCSACSLKNQAIEEFKSLGIADLPEFHDLYALSGSYVNLEYVLPNGQTVKLLEDDKIYLGNQLCKADGKRCYGLVASDDILLVCEYGENGADAEIIVYKKRG